MKHEEAYPNGINVQLWEIARNCYMSAERYAMTVCSGELSSDGILPADEKELKLNEDFARDRIAEAYKKARVLGFSDRDCKNAMRQYSKSLQFSYDIRGLHEKP